MILTSCRTSSLDKYSKKLSTAESLGLSHGLCKQAAGLQKLPSSSHQTGSFMRSTPSDWRSRLSMRSPSDKGWRLCAREITCNQRAIAVTEASRLGNERHGRSESRIHSVFGKPRFTVRLCQRTERAHCHRLPQSRWPVRSGGKCSAGNLP